MISLRGGEGPDQEGNPNFDHGWRTALTWIKGDFLNDRPIAGAMPLS
jgi:hypothetical protein